MTIGQWLRELGLERYEAAFVDGAIDFDLLPDVTDAHLKELGIPLGHRLRLTQAIAKLNKPVEPSDTPPVVQKPERFRHAGTEAERRQLTVMFVDLVGSTELSSELDPEDMGEVIRSYQNAVAGEIARYDGYVAKFMGDGVLAYFGWPHAHENEAERAVRAGLAVVDAVSRLPANRGQSLAARIGIATGRVVVGDLIGSEEARERAVVGGTPNLAARLQNFASPNAVVIAQSTLQMLGSMFEVVDLGSRDVRGFRTPVRAWQVVRERATEGRFEAFHGAGMVPLVGREHEMQILMERWAWARSGEGQVMLLSGEPGIGKSRLVQGLRDHLQGEMLTRVRHQCSPFYVNSAFYPVIEQITRAAGIQPGDPPPTKLDKLEALLSQGTEAKETAASLVAKLLSIPGGTRFPSIELTPQRQKEETIRILVEQIAGLAAREPMFIVWEDAHWIDPTSLELLDRLVDAVEKLPVLVVITFRPEFKPAWIGLPQVTVLALNRLGRAAVASTQNHT